MGTKSAERAARAARRGQERNKAARSLAKTAVTKAERLLTTGEVEPAKTEAVKAFSALDRAAKQGVIHPNNAARRKSRLAKKLNKRMAAPNQAGPAKPS